MRKALLKLAASLLVGTIACANVSATELNWGSIAPTKSPWGAWAMKVKEKLETESGGKLTINLLLDGQAGDEQAMVGQTARGRLDMTMVSNTALSLLSKEVGLTSAPFLWESDAQGTCANHKHLIQAVSPLLDKAGVKPLAWMEVGHQIIFAKSPVKVPADLAGKKLRTAPTLSDTLYANGIGTSAVPLSPADTIPALQTGNVDAATWPMVFGIAVGTHKVAPMVTVTNHIRQVGALVISNRTWAKLTDEEKGWLSQLTSTGEDLTAAVFAAEGGLLGQLESAGIAVYRPSESEMAEWKNAATGVLGEMVKEIGGDAPAIADAIASAKAACGS